jgi:hypothetical protein
VTSAPNITPPSADQLPSAARLRRATVLAAIAAVALIVIVVLPAERGYDPTGLGQRLGLTQMGKFKVQAAKEFAAADSLAAKRAADAAASADSAQRRARADTSK